MQNPKIRVAPLPVDPSLNKRVDWLTRKTVRLAAKSASARPYESYEYHLVHWKLPWLAALAAMRGISSRVAANVDTVVIDDACIDSGFPFGNPLAALPLDVITCEEALALQDIGFRFEIAIRFWPGVDGAMAHDINSRLACAQRRAGKKAHTFYRSTGDAFIYSRSFPRSLRLS